MSVECEICQKTFSSRSVLYRHIREVHKIEQRRFQQWDFNIYNNKCFTCYTSFKYLKDLREHLVQSHDFVSETEELSFQTNDKFERWLEETCKKDKVQYILTRGVKKMTTELGSGKICWYSCNRSVRCVGKAIEKERKRTIKTQGSRKLNYACTSQIKLTEMDGFCFVTYYKTHYRHDKELKHLRITKSEKEVIAQKLLAGIPTSEWVNNRIFLKSC